MKTEQQKRFESAWLSKWLHNHPSIFTTFEDGTYEIETVQDTFEGFQLGEASGLALAAAECDSIGCAWRVTGDMQKFYATNRLVEVIRALTQENKA